MKNKKGFTLIELLAVIVILGLLMAIAIPSVTKYITESRKKTLTTTLGNYIGALVNEVNDLAYTFTGTNTIYAVPIECISLERGGTDPFGEWHQANDAYFAYVLVQYDDTTSKYVYGFTFKDSAGYGLYPTIQGNINEKGSQVKTGYTLNRPKTGELTSLTSLSKWQESGFKVDSNTHLQVLISESEGKIGNGKDSCTLTQKGNNYEQAEEENQIIREQIEFEQNMMSYPAYALYSSSDKSLTFVRSNKVIKAGDTYDNKVVTKVYTGFETATYTGSGWVPWYTYRKTITKVIVKHEIVPVSMAYWFYEFHKCSSFDVAKINTSKVVDMQYTFYQAAYDTTFAIFNVENWDTSNVTNMRAMFNYVGCDAGTVSLNLSKWNVSKVTNMSGMFFGVGYYCYGSVVINLENWNASKVTDIGQMFGSVGRNAQSINIKMRNLKFSSLQSMAEAFWGLGYEGKYVMIDAANVDVSNVTNLNNTFRMVGSSATTTVYIDLTNWNTAKVTTMNETFLNVGISAPNVNINGVQGFNVINVTSMNKTFYLCGYNSSLYINLGGWIVPNVTSHTDFNSGVESKIIAPSW